MHDAPVGGKEYGRVGLRDAFRIDADIARNRLFGRISASAADLQRPNTLSGESVERELTELSLRESLDSRTYALYLACTHGVDAEDGEIERIAHLGSVDFIWDIYCAVGNARYGRSCTFLFWIVPTSKIE